jgi:hypothetical protein
VNAQDGIVALLAALALGWLVLRAVRARRSKSGACAHCPAAAPVAGVRPAPQLEVLVGIEDPAPRGGSRK